MKKYLPSYLLAAAAAVGLVLAGCNKHDRADASATVKNAANDTAAAVKNAANDTQAALSNAWGEVKSFTYEKRNDFSSKAKAMASQAEVQVSELRANYSEAQASASRKAAMEELKNSEADYKAKLDALGHATADTWEAAKNNVILAWDKLEASIRKARAN